MAQLSLHRTLDGLRPIFYQPLQTYEQFDLSKLPSTDSVSLLVECQDFLQMYTKLVQELKKFNKSIISLPSVRKANQISLKGSASFSKLNALFVPMYRDMLFLNSYDSQKTKKLLCKWSWLVNSTLNQRVTPETQSSQSPIVLKEHRNIKSLKKSESLLIKTIFGLPNRDRHTTEQQENDQNIFPVKKVDKNQSPFVRSSLPGLTRCKSHKYNLISLQRALSNYSPHSYESSTKIKQQNQARKQRIYGCTDDLLQKSAYLFDFNPDNKSAAQKDVVNQQNARVFKDWLAKKQCELIHQVISRSFQLNYFQSEVLQDKKAQFRYRRNIGANLFYNQAKVSKDNQKSMHNPQLAKTQQE